MVRILHYGLSENLGGIETYLNKVYSHIDKSKFSFEFLIVGNEEPCFYEKFKKMGAKFHVVPDRKKGLIKNKKAIREVLNNNDFDIIHCHMNSLSYGTPIIESIKSGIPTIVHSRNGSSPNKIHTKILHKFYKTIINKDKIIKFAVSDLAGTWMFGRNENFVTINNGVDTNKYKYSKEKREKMRKELGLNLDQICVINVGALRPQKNHMFLIDVFNEIKGLEKDAKLLLVGDGMLKNDITYKINELKLEENVLMLGERNDISELLSASDVFIFPSFYEGFPNAVLEAQATGISCIISNTITEQVIVNKNCYLFSLSESPKIWAEKSLEIIDNFDRLSKVENIKKIGLSVSDEIKKLEKLYINIMQNSNVY